MKRTKERQFRERKKYTPLDPAPCDTCLVRQGCKVECLVFSHWVNTGRILSNLIAKTEKGTTK